MTEQEPIYDIYLFTPSRLSIEYLWTNGTPITIELHSDREGGTIVSIGNVTEILINRDTEDITITPTLGYDFSQVIGNLSASYNSHKDRKSGTTRITINLKLSVQLDF